MEGLKRLNELVDAPKAPGVKEDKDFKPNDSSLGSKLSKGKDLGWRDFSKDGKLFLNGMDPSDIKQGDLGSCYFLSAISSICMKKPDLLKDRLQSNGSDWYGIRWYVGGKPRDTWVDDKFPTRDGKIRFAHSEKNELWVAVMEKCYAKEHSTYRAIEGGFPGDAMHDITGKPTNSHNLQENWDAENWRVLSECWYFWISFEAHDTCL
jgi:calpain-15